jgi:hypothetical protein
LLLLGERGRQQSVKLLIVLQSGKGQNMPEIA